MTAHGRNYLRISLVFAVCSILISLIARSKGIELLPDNPTRNVAQTSMAFWETGHLSHPELYRTFESVVTLSKSSPNTLVWQDRFSLSSHGQLLPKHAVMFAVVISPTYGLFGEFCFWLINQLSLVAILFGIYALCAVFTSERSSLVASFLFAFGTQILLMLYGFNYDLSAAAAILWSFLLARKWCVAAPILIILAFLIRPTNILFGLLVPIWLYFSVEQSNERKHAAVRYFISFWVCALPVLIVNFLLWGAPISGAYARLPTFSNGEILFDTTTHVFSASLLLNSFLARMIFGPDSVVWWYPASMLSVLGLVRAIRTRRLTYSLGSLLLTAFLFGGLMMGFPSWEGIGSWRFILPSVILVWPLVAVAIDRQTAR